MRSCSWSAILADRRAARINRIGLPFRLYGSPGSIGIGVDIMESGGEMLVDPLPEAPLLRNVATDARGECPLEPSSHRKRMKLTPAALAAALSRPRKLLADPPEPERLDLAGEKIAVHTQGRPDAVARALLVHGWETDYRDFSQIAEALARDGVYCVAPDLPAHGKSSGASMTIPEGARALQAVHQAYGPFELAVGYSIGAAVLLYALSKGLPAKKIALIAPPGNYVRELSKAAHAAGVPEALIAPALNQFRRRCPDLDEIDCGTMALSLSCTGIIAVAGNDRIADPEEGRRVARHWRGSRLLEFERSSRLSIMCDARLIKAIAGLL